MTTPNADLGTIWMAAYDDWSGVAMFVDEADALRFGNEHGGMIVAEIRYGEIVGPGWRPSPAARAEP